MIEIYVAGASKEAVEISAFMRKLEASGKYSITFDWTVEVLRRQREGLTDSTLTDLEKNTFAALDFDAVNAADVFWLVYPETGSAGAFVELGLAMNSKRSPEIVVSGDYSKNIFAYLVYEPQRFDTDKEALAYLLGAMVR